MELGVMVDDDGWKKKWEVVCIGANFCSLCINKGNTF